MTFALEPQVKKESETKNGICFEQIFKKADMSIKGDKCKFNHDVINHWGFQI